MKKRRVKPKKFQPKSTQKIRIGNRHLGTELIEVDWGFYDWSESKQEEILAKWHQGLDLPLDEIVKIPQSRKEDLMQLAVDNWAESQCWMLMSFAIPNDPEWLSCGAMDHRMLAGVSWKRLKDWLRKKLKGRKPPRTCPNQQCINPRHYGDNMKILNGREAVIGNSDELIDDSFGEDFENPDSMSWEEMEPYIHPDVKFMMEHPGIYIKTGRTKL